MEIGKEYTLPELRAFFKCGQHIASTLAANFLDNSSRGHYSRSFKEPVYYKRIETVLDRMRERIYNHNSVQKLELNEENCIQYLKERGYKILKPTFEEV
jgi:hypothetical protein